VHLGRAEAVSAVSPVSNDMKQRRLCLVTASEGTVRVFLAPHLRAMQRHYDITLVVNTANTALLHELGVDGTLVRVRIERRVSPWRDLTALVALFRVLRNGSFDLVHSMTPKAGLLAMTAAWLARIPVRMHTFTGQVWATRRGISRAILRSCDVLVARLATITLADSPSQRDFLVQEGVGSGSAMVVIGKGSVKGVDAATFRPDAAVRRTVRASLGAAPDDVLLLYVGRLTRDKGVLDLAAAFTAIADERPDVRLVIVGPDEEGLQPALAAGCADHADRVQFFGLTDRPQDFMAAADVLCLPSYREGMPTVIIEAAACGVPAVASRIYGIVDAVDEGTTGLLHRARDARDLADALRRITADATLRHSLGSAARERAEREFAVSRMVAGQLSLYAEVLERPGAGRSWYRRFGKRMLDIVVASFALVSLTPLLIVLALLVRLTLGAPVLFRQRRAGLNGRPFVLVKFRSMTDRYDADGRPLPDADRLTAVGRFLRASSLDELPELWNVLKGDMSLVGPRPLLMEYLERYTDQEARRHEVPPGISGWAQVNGRNTLTWADKFRLDVWYVDHQSFRLDCLILRRTLAALVTRRGISQPGHATAEEFRDAGLAER
jgi:lipopolysaccharide/colanic/teichoic acid biosynthesis glycosyltransferase/UDP-N-acetylglucosamine:LPS N-acetylglucosamine transferase